MGVIYKLKPEVTAFILKAREKDPRLGCRAIAGLVEKKFKSPISKSSVNQVLQSSGVSLSVGRRRKSRRNESFGKGLGALLLKSADSLIGGTAFIAEELKKESGLPSGDIQAALEYLLYQPLFNVPYGAQPDNGLWTLINRLPQEEGVIACAEKLQINASLPLSAVKEFLSLARPVRGIRIELSDSSAIYLDGQLHTAWPKDKVPYGLSTTFAQANFFAQAYARDDAPITFFMAPGYDAPTKEFFTFMKNTVNGNNRIVSFELLGPEFKELAKIKAASEKKDFLIFGLWPWQFSGLSKIKVSGDFHSIYFGPLKESYYIAPAQVVLSQNEESVSFKGCALKSGITEEIRLVIVTNHSLDNSSLDNFVGKYLKYWPNFEPTFQDFSHKIGPGDQAKGLEHQLDGFAHQPSYKLEEVLSGYRQILNLFVSFYFLPPAYNGTSFTAMKERFYSLSASIKAQQGYSTVLFQAPAEYHFLKELTYACRRLNEKNIQLEANKRVWFLL